MKQVVAYRKTLDITQKQMADLLSITPGWYSKKESGKKPWNSNEMEIIINELRKSYPNITSTIFFDDTVNKPLTL